MGTRFIKESKKGDNRDASTGQSHEGREVSGCGVPPVFRGRTNKQPIGDNDMSNDKIGMGKSMDDAVEKWLRAT